MSLSMENNTELEATTKEMLSGFQQDLKNIRQASLLQGLDDDCLNLLAMLCQRIKYSDADQLMIQGEDDGHAFFILSGLAQAIYRKGEATVEIQQFGPGEFVGGCALFGRLPRLFTLIAKGELSALRLSREQFEKAMVQFPASFAKITGNLVMQLAAWDLRLQGIYDENSAESQAIGVSLL